jgi:hypothetical protein
MTFKRKWFITYKAIVPQKMYVEDDTILEAVDKGNIKVIMQM